MFKIIGSISNTVSKSLTAIDNLIDAISGITGIVKEAVEASVLEQRIEALQDLKASAKKADISEEELTALKIL